MARMVPEAAPLREPVLTANRFTDRWERFWQALTDELSARSVVCAVERHAGLSGAAAEAQIVTRDALPAGLYRVSFSRTPAMVGGSVTLTAAWTAGAVRHSASSALPSWSVLMDVDAGTTIGWSAAHVAPPATYNLAIVLERLR